MRGAAVRGVMRLACSIVIAVTATLAATREARADRFGDAAHWGAVVVEAGEIPAVYLATREEMNAFAQQGILWTPIFIGAGVTYLAYRGEWDPRIPRAIHGGAWTGLNLFLVGGLVEGSEGDGFEMGVLAWSLGALGAAAGAYVGATEVDESASEIAWMTGFLGGGAGAIVGGFAAIVAQSWSTKKTGQVVGWSSVVGLTIGLGIGYVMAFTDEPREADRGGRAALHPDVGLGGVMAPTDAVMFGFSGTF